MYLKSPTDWMPSSITAWWMSLGTSCSTRSSCGVNPPAAGNEAHELVGVEGPVRLPWDGCCCHPDRRVEGDKAALLIVVARDLQHVVLGLARHLRIDQAPVQAAVAQEAFPVAHTAQGGRGQDSQKQQVHSTQWQHGCSPSLRRLAAAWKWTTAHASLAPFTRRRSDRVSSRTSTRGCPWKKVRALSFQAAQSTGDKAMRR